MPFTDSITGAFDMRFLYKKTAPDCCPAPLCPD
jgi:hypothetical protein